MLLILLPVPGSQAWTGAAAEGDRLASQHRLLSALRWYEAAMARPGGLPAARIRLTRTHLRRGQAAEAANLFQQAAAAGSPSREVLLGLAEALEARGDAAGALEALARDLALRPGDAGAWVRLVERAARAGLPPTRVRELLGSASPPPIQSPPGPRAAYLLGAAVLGGDSPEGAAALRAAASGRDPATAVAARELFEAAAGADVRARAVSLAATLLAQGLPGPALEVLEGVNPGGAVGARALALRGHALARAGRPEEAEAALRRAAEGAPEEPLGLFLLGSFLRGRGDGEGAARLLESAARRDPGNPAIYAELAETLAQVGDYGTAEQALGLAVAAAPESGELRLAAAVFHADHQYRPEAAIEDARQAVQLTRRSAAALTTLGWLLHLSGRPGEALDPLLEAVAQDPESPALRYRLGAVHEALGRHDAAREQYLMVGEVDGGGEWWRRARAALDELP